MDELLESHEALCLELNELKSQFGRALDLVNVLLSYHRPAVVPEVIPPVKASDSNPHQELPHGYYPDPRSSKVLCQQSLPVPRPRQSNPVQNQYPNQ